MGRIKKTATERHEATISPYITAFIKELVAVPLHKLPQHIASFPNNWPFPRGDLYHWIAPLNRFDRILERFNTEYALDKGPQTQPFSLRLLQKGDAEDGSVTDVAVQELRDAGYSDDGDRELIECILNFTRLLLEHCGNRSLYASSAHLNHLLNTVSLSLLKATLRVTLRLAQRYHTSRMRVASPHALNALLAGHYNINLDRIQKLANPFPKKPSVAPIFGQTPVKNKDKDESAKTAVNPSDIETLIKAKEIPQSYQNELSGVHLTYYEKTEPSAASADSQAPNTPGSPLQPVTPTPVRRTSNLGPGSARSERPSAHAEAPETPVRPNQAENAASNGPKVFELSPSQVSGVQPWQLLHDNLTKVPEESQYDLLHRIRVASAFKASKSEVHDLVAVRILAISNLAYVYGESTFASRIGQPDSEEPRKTQLAQQLTDMLQPPTSGQDELSLDMTHIVIQALEALAKSKPKAQEVANALNITVSHGVLFYVLRKILATLGDEQSVALDHEWCKDVFDLIMTLTPPSPHPQRNADVLVSAGFVGILVDILRLRTKQAEVYFPIALGFFDNFIHNGVREVFQALVNAKGLDVLADLTATEVQHSIEAARNQEGLPAAYKTKITDYQIPFNSQQTLRQLLKFVAHMYHHNIGTDDRLLRNFIDSPQLLGALRTIIDNASVFGSNVWSGAMNILSSFIHNEPTSYQVIAEAGLSKAFLEAITKEPITVSDVVVENADESMQEDAAPTAPAQSVAPGSESTASGVLPVGETMRDIPTAFGAICLNENGMRMFQASKALEKFLEIFESPEHVKAMEEDSEAPQYIGTAFDELVRHHPQLKERTSQAVLGMVQNVLNLCRERANQKGVGAKLWSAGQEGNLVAGGRVALRGLTMEELEAAEDDDDTNFSARMSRDESTSTVTESQIDSDTLVKGRGIGNQTSDFIAMVARFLGGFLSNHSMSAAFCESAGGELLLDMATAACNPYNFNETAAQEEICRVIQQLVEHKPHLILPSLARRTQLAILQLRPLIEHRRGNAYFSSLTDQDAQGKGGSQNAEIVENSTYTAKAMVQAQVLCQVYAQVFAMHVYHANRPTPHHFFGQVNLTDVYTDLIDDLGQLYSSCVWEAITMRHNMPEEWSKQIHITGMSFDNSEADNVMGLTTQNSESSAAQSRDPESGDAIPEAQQVDSPKRIAARDLPQYKNCQVLASLLNQVSTGVLSLFQSFGKSLLWKPSQRVPLSDYQKQNSAKLAEHLAVALIDHMSSPQASAASEVDRVSYDIVVLTSTLQTLLDERKHARTGGSHREVFTMVLQKFLQKGGFKELESRLQKFGKLVEQHKSAVENTSTSDDVTSSKRIHALALAGVDKILEFYNKICLSKNIQDAQQSTALSVRDRQKSDFFLASQFLVEIRDIIIPQAGQMWKSPVMESLSVHTVKSVIDLLRLVLEGDGEQSAVKRSEDLKRRVASEPRKWKMSTTALGSMKTEGFDDEELCVEALFRCNNSGPHAREYYELRRNNDNRTLPCYPLPKEEEPQQADQETQNRPSNVSADQSSAPTLDRVPSVEMQDADDATRETDSDPSDDALGGGNRRMVLPRDMLSGGIAEVLSHALGGGEELLRTLPVHRRASDDASRPADVTTEESFVTIDDLDDKRKEVRDGLIDRCLDVLNTHTDVTFELADLITAAVAKATENQISKSEIGQTLVNSLMSLRPDEGSPFDGKKIASYAHLLALVVQDREFFEASLDALKENFDQFAAIIKMYQGQKPDESSPWVSNILLIVERVLAEDEQPQQIKWVPPPFEDPYKEQDVVELKAPIVPDEEKASVFDALVEILPRIGKDESLALSVVRTLVILTRRRALAKKLGEKLSISRLFVMAKQLAGVAGDRLQNTFLVLLRHIIEDEETIRNTMLTEIQATFENKGLSRTMDTTLYTRTLYYLAIRSPEIFVEATNEKVKLARWDQNRAGGAQPLALKTSTSSDLSNETSKETEDQAEGSKAAASERPGIERTKTTDLKLPSIENPDGVIQFLLKELSSYKDVEDNEQQQSVKLVPVDTGSATSVDVEMSDSTSATTSEQAAVQSNDEQTKSPEKPSFKADQHPIFAYRCFILQCLVELLQSYNRTKIEFINFSRKAEYQASTPSKPRSGLLNYFLTSLIPVGILQHPDDIGSRKRAATSTWAINAIVALCSKTNERVISLKISGAEEETDLAYVRKFVLEHALKAFKDAVASSEPLEQKYARLLSLSDLFYRMLNGKSHATANPFILDMVSTSQKQLGRFMYEKNFITALTSSIAEIDLNFPGSKRAIKYILRPLKLLTDIGVTLSISGDVSAPGTTEDDEISSATSVSDDDDEHEREETPDLFRNSTLGMFEAADSDDDEGDSGSDEAEEYYEGEYDEEMEYDEYDEAGPGMHEGDVVSDDDEEIEGMGPIEGLSGDVDLEIAMDQDDDDESGEDDEDDSDMDDADSDEGDDIEIIDEITGDDENDSMEDDDDDEDDMEEDDEEDWEDEGDDPYRGPVPMNVLGAAPAGAFVPALDDDRSDTMDQLEGDDPVMTLDMGGPEQYFEDEMVEDDEDENDDEDEEVLGYEPEHDDPENDEMDWGWGGAAMPPGTAGWRRHGHFYTMDDAPLGLPRSHRAGVINRVDEDGTNPLLQRSGRFAAPGQPPRSGLGPAALDWLSEGRPGPGGNDGLSFVSDLVQMIGPQGTRISVVDGSGALSLPPGNWTGGMPPAVIQFAGAGGPPQFRFPDLRAIQRITNRLGHREPAAGGRLGSSDPSSAMAFQPAVTVARWQDEARLLFNNNYIEKALKVVESMLRILVPPAMEARRQKDKADAERKAAEDKAREEQRQKEEAERIEREAREQKEKEEREAKEAEEAAARAREQAELGESQIEPQGMEGVERPETASADAPRVTTNIRGRELDITNLGIDLEYLDALPEEMREEVIMQQFQVQRSQAAESGQESSEINREFLEALPPDIQQELLASEAADRRRRERDEARRRATAGGNAPPVAQAGEMDMADFFATLNPNLRQQVLMDADEGTFAAFPAEFQAEARALFGDRRGWRGERPGRDAEHSHDDQDTPAPEEQRVRRPVIQMLDKAGVATLLRLMFVSIQGNARNTMQAVLSDVCKNTQNRSEVISILLSILQDGSADANALEKSFAQLTLRAKQISGQKTPQPLKRSLTGSQLMTPNAEVSPLMIVQQCLNTLTHLANENPRVSTFFLLEHEPSVNQRAKALKKGKGKDSKASKYPLNALLTLLDRKSIIENTFVMEALASLLIRVTEPLKVLLRKAREADKEKEKAAENSEAVNPDVTMAEGSNSNTDNSAPPNGDQPQTTEVKPEEKKKHRDLTPPEVPEENLRLVVNIIAARECNAKTFQSTLDIINHLSAIPGAKETFGQELVHRAQELGDAVLVDLQALAPQIQDAKSSTDVQGIALANFSPASSHQSKLLRVLLALDYLFDPKRSGDRPASASSDSSVSKARRDLLSSLYESSTFVKLWSNLSDCLTAIRQRGNMNNVATILQPLIESFMVVCKNTTSKDAAPLAASQELPTGTPQPDSRIEKLFFTFTEEHRKILNDLVRNNPKLLNGTFDVLAKNSKVLEFDNKRNYFTRRLHTRSTEDRISHPTVQLNIRRDQIFMDSFKNLYYKSPNEIKYGKLNIRFHGEEGVDAGGVSREWFAALSRQMFNPDYALFNPVASDRTTFHPNPMSDVNPEHLTFFKFIGRIIGKALYEGRVLDCHFSRAVYRRILGKPVSLKDMETLDLDYYKSLCWMLENDITDVAFETFSVEVDRFGETETIDLIPGGRDVSVTEENKQEYVRLVVEHRLVKSVEEQLEHFLTGFHEIVPAELIAIFNEQELELLISGLPDIDVDDWKNNSEYHNYSLTSPQVQWFWRAVRSFDKEEKAKLLQFVTGTSKVPLNGFKELEGMNGFTKFNIHKDYGNKDRLPSSHTCFNQLDLPEYETYEALRHQMYTAMTQGSEYFGFA